MTYGLPPARDGVERRLDILIDRLDRLLDTLASPRRVEPPDGTVELRGVSVRAPHPRTEAPARRPKGP